MNRTRNAFVLCVTGFVGSLIAPAVHAQQYPNRTIHFLAAGIPGGGADVTVRFFAEKIRPLTGTTVIVENQAGGGGNIALTRLANAKPDGYTILVFNVNFVAGSMSLFKTPSVDVAKQIQVAATINEQSGMIAVHARSPYKTLADLTAALKEKGDRASYGSASPSLTVIAELYKSQAGLSAVRVDYRSGPLMVSDVETGALDFIVCDSLQGTTMQAKGDWRILGISIGKRLQSTGSLPTMTEQGVPMDISSWWGAMVPVGTPRDVVDQIDSWFRQSLQADDTKKFLSQVGSDPLSLTPDAAQARMLRDIEVWKELVKVAKIQPLG